MLDGLRRYWSGASVDGESTSKRARPSAPPTPLSLDTATPTPSPEPFTPPSSFQKLVDRALACPPAQEVRPEQLDRRRIHAAAWMKLSPKKRAELDLPPPLLGAGAEAVVVRGGFEEMGGRYDVTLDELEEDRGHALFDVYDDRSVLHRMTLSAYLGIYRDLDARPHNLIICDIPSTSPLRSRVSPPAFTKDLGSGLTFIRRKSPSPPDDNVNCLTITMPGFVTDWHHDSAALVSETIIEGEKVWVMCDARDPRNLSGLVKAYESGWQLWPGDLGCRLSMIRQLPGDTVIVPPFTYHYVLTLAPAVMFGGITLCWGDFCADAITSNPLFLKEQVTFDLLPTILHNLGPLLDHVQSGNADPQTLLEIATVLSSIRLRQGTPKGCARQCKAILSLIGEPQGRESLGQRWTEEMQEWVRTEQTRRRRAQHARSCK